MSPLSSRANHDRQGGITRAIDLSPEAYERAAREQAAREAIETAGRAASGRAVPDHERSDWRSPELRGEAATNHAAPGTSDGSSSEGEILFRRVLPGETFKPSVPLEKLEELFPDGTHRNIKAAREYVGILQATGQLTENKWGVLERVSGEVDGFAQALNLYEPAASQVKAAAVSAGAQAAQQTMAEQAPRVRYPVIRREAANTAGQSVQQRMAGQMPAAAPAVARAIQNATPRAGLRWAEPSRILRVGDREWEIYGRQYRQLDLSPIEKKGSASGVIEGISRIPGNVASGVYAHGRDGRNEMPQHVKAYQATDALLQDIGFDVEMNPYEAFLEKSQIGSLVDKWVSPHSLARGTGRLTAEDGSRLLEYAKRGLHSTPAEMSEYRRSMEKFYELSRATASADKGVDLFEMLGNFVSPHLKSENLAKPAALYRGDVVPAEHVARTRVGSASGRGGEMNLSPFTSGAGSFSIEPFQAYRYSMYNRDNRLEKARQASPTGQAVRRIIEVALPKGELVPVLNSDGYQEGKSELVFPQRSAGYHLVSENQLFNASDPEVPLLWQTYAPARR